MAEWGLGREGFFLVQGYWLELRENLDALMKLEYCLLALKMASKANYDLKFGIHGPHLHLFREITVGYPILSEEFLVLVA